MLCPPPAASIPHAAPLPKQPGPTESPTRKPYPSDGSDDDWAFIAVYLTLMAPDALQRRHALREAFNALRYLVRSGVPWRMPLTRCLPRCYHI